jgi:hypothetical protein
MLSRALPSALVRTFSTASFIRSVATNKTVEAPENDRPCGKVLRGRFRLNSARNKHVLCQRKTAYV